MKMAMTIEEIVPSAWLLKRRVKNSGNVMAFSSLNMTAITGARRPKATNVATGCQRPMTNVESPSFELKPANPTMITALK